MEYCKIQKNIPLSHVFNGVNGVAFGMHKKIFKWQTIRLILHTMHLFCEIRAKYFARSFKSILREAKPRFCLSAPDLP